MKRFFRILAAVLVITLSAGSVGAYISKAAINWQNEEDKEEYEAAKEQLDKINAQKKDIAAQLKALSSEKSSKVKKKTLIESQLEATNTEIETLEWVIAELDVRLAEKTVELAQAEKDYDEYYERYKARIRETFEVGELSYMEALLSSTNLSELIARMDYISDIMEYDKKNLEALQELRAKADTARKDIALQKEEQEEALGQCEIAKADLQAQKKDLDKAIKDLNEDAEALEEMEIEFEKASKELDKQLESLIDKNRKYAGGDFTWPLPLSVHNITSKFGVERNYTVNGKKYHDVHSGIDIAAAKGTEIYAANDGKIIYYKKDSTGSNTCCIDHGSSVVTKYYHMSSFVSGLKVGDEVKKGQLIGYVGMTGLATGNHLHFMIVINGKNVNPLDYVTYDGSTPKKTITW
ncbi:MAG: murein hydrolase activator EnvC family protein [Eubacteriales bacterium]